MVKTSISLLLFCSPLYGITFCNLKDCYEIESSIVDSYVEKCLYQARMNMLILEWKRINRWEQVQWIGGNKTLNCMPRIPRMFLDGSETEEQLVFLDELRCRLHNMKRDPVLYQIYYFDICMDTFKPEKHLR
tara:strand:- start:13 stop:408 length:396 start_codon:yes stop_codon:yes gene_type:complete